VSRRIQSFQDYRRSIARDRWCPLHGPVTRYHGCKATEPEIFGEVVVAYDGPLREAGS
jgi:hypothetical protein